MALISAASCTRAFLSTWVLRFGFPALLTSDRGSQCKSSVWLEVCSILGFSPIQTNSFHLQSNRMIKHFHHSLKSARDNWVQYLPWVLLGLRATHRDNTCFSLTKAVYGSTLLLTWRVFGFPRVPSGVLPPWCQAGCLRVLWSSTLSGSPVYLRYLHYTEVLTRSSLGWMNFLLS